ncbi:MULTISPECIES: hypothetical protein [unclassified Microcoleus]|uniref:hypothetical protein n=1 Tax=unclassified Microcoleus TaxID=2642155 RepID=UPI002FD2F437
MLFVFPGLHKFNKRSRVEIAPRQFSEELLMLPVVHSCQKLHGKLQGKVGIFGKVRSPAIENQPYLVRIRNLPAVR